MPPDLRPGEQCSRSSLPSVRRRAYRVPVWPAPPSEWRARGSGRLQPRSGGMPSGGRNRERRQSSTRTRRPLRRRPPAARDAVAPSRARCRTDRRSDLMCASPSRSSATELPRFTARRYRWRRPSSTPPRSRSTPRRRNTSRSINYGRARSGRLQFRQRARRREPQAGSCARYPRARWRRSLTARLPTRPFQRR
jgi:hypothetical protein